MLKVTGWKYVGKFCACSMKEKENLRELDSLFTIKCVFVNENYEMKSCGFIRTE